jgi:hypothetical protein
MDLLKQNMTGTTKLTKACFFRDTACDGRRDRDASGIVRPTPTSSPPR